MPYFAVRVEFEFDFDDGDLQHVRQEARAGVIESGSAEGACAMARVAYKPEGCCWSASQWEAVECADDDDAVRVAREMEGWGWLCSR